MPLQVPPKFVKYILPKGFVAVDGISLTVGEVGEDSFSVYLIPETLRVTTLGMRKEGDAVNIEIEAQTQVLFSDASPSCASCHGRKHWSCWTHLGIKSFRKRKA